MPPLLFKGPFRRRVPRGTAGMGGCGEQRDWVEIGLAELIGEWTYPKQGSAGYIIESRLGLTGMQRSGQRAQ